MDPLQHSFPVRETLQRIESPDSVTFQRPINRRGRIEGQGARVAQPLRFGQIGFAAPERLLCPPLLGDVAPYTAVPDKPSRSVEYRQPRDGHIALATVGRRSRKLEVSEWQMGIEGLAVLAPGLLVRLEVRHFPPSLADFGAGRWRVSQPFGKLLANEAMLRVALPVHVERELDEGAKALLAPAQLFLRLPQLRDVLQDAKLAHGVPQFVPRHVALAVDYSLRAVRADDPIFDVVAWSARR